MPTIVRRHAKDLAGLAIPIIELTGTRGGPTLTVIAGVHGCEYAPMAAVRQWANDLAGRDLHGTVRAVPVLNLPAFEARSPFVVPADGKNLNRCFPGDPAGTLAERLAHAVFTDLISSSDALVDAHCGDLPEALEPFALYDAGVSEAKARAMAIAYGLGYVIRQEPGPDRAVGGTTSAAAADIGIPAIIAEAGGCGLVDQRAVDQHLAGLDRVLAALGMAEPRTDAAGHGPVGTPGTQAGPTMLSRFIWLRCDEGGWWQPAVQPGETVAAGQVLGTVSSIDGGQMLQRITAPVAGVPMFVTSSPAVEADGLLLGLGAS